MSQIIFHHYETSPFAKKIRVLFGLKNISWQSVDIPRIMPKPDVTALTGGYRRTPVLQIGADIYCDTALIARKLNELFPSPDLYLPEHALSGLAISQWADTQLFQNAVPLAFQKEVINVTFGGNEELMTKFITDRAAMSKNAPRRRILLAEANTFFDQCLQQLDAQLADGRQFLLGDKPSIADLSMYHPLWFIKTKPIVCEKFAPYANIQRWMQHLDSVGEGQATPLDSGAALTIAKESPAEPLPTTSSLLDFHYGDDVVVSAGDYGFDPVAGCLVYCDEHEIALARRDERAGDVVVHFPRINYDVRKP